MTGPELAAFRNKRDLSQQKLAIMLGMSVAAVAQNEGKIRVSKNIVEKIKEKFDIQDLK